MFAGTEEGRGRERGGRGFWLPADKASSAGWASEPSRTQWRSLSTAFIAVPRNAIPCIVIGHHQTPWHGPVVALRRRSASSFHHPFVTRNLFPAFVKCQLCWVNLATLSAPASHWFSWGGGRWSWCYQRQINALIAPIVIILYTAEEDKKEEEVVEKANEEEWPLWHNQFKDPSQEIGKLQ